MTDSKLLLQDSRRPHSDQQQVYNTLKGKLNPIPDRISGPAQELVLSMLQTDPSKRPSLEQIAKHPCITNLQSLDAAFQFEVQLKLMTNDNGVIFASVWLLISEISFSAGK